MAKSSSEKDLNDLSCATRISEMHRDAEEVILEPTNDGPSLVRA